MTGSDDIAMLEDIRHSSHEAVAAAVHQHNRRLWRIARGILGDDSDAEDAVQDAYVRAFTSLDTFRGDASLGTWLARIAINEALRRAERRNPTVDLDEVAERLPAYPAGAATMAPSAEETQPCGVLQRRSPRRDAALSRRALHVPKREASPTPIIIRPAKQPGAAPQKPRRHGPRSPPGAP